MSTPREAPILQLGLSAYDLSMANFLALARAADAAGVDSLWLGEHVFHPREYTSVHPGSAKKQHHSGPVVQERTHLLDPLTALSAAAVVTERIRLATGILVLPLRDPLLVSRALATLDEISGGRIVLGVGAGWLEEEFQALGIEFGDRGRRLREAVTVIRSCLGGGFVEHHGKVFDFDALQVVEEPVHVPLIMGGNSDVALKRAASVGDGWFSSGSLSQDEAVALRRRVLDLLDERGRDETSFEMVVRPDRSDADGVVSCVEAGYRHVVVWADQVWSASDPAEVQVERLRDALGTMRERAR
ncbi:TIGR03619 family F420-dependent LLM class oxidoreductase [Aeromicrobium sp. Sec7.5]|uniref:TIGR03619 family F420-dependent LLM class oxidoreductase n=1 Tax=Aeromicrobium sp. Sec7.5 TaxID=3121276 RepID=UPI002FE4F8A8